MVLGAFGQLILDARKIFEVRKSRVILVLYAITIGGVHQLGDLVAGSVLLPGQLSLKALCICPKIVGSALQATQGIVKLLSTDLVLLLQ